MSNLRKLLFPFSLIYHGITEVRNRFYDLDILRSKSFEVPVIAVGNLNMGGTGKSPMIEYLIGELSKKYKVATLSRGYRRDSKGFQLVEETDPVERSGDEPLQFKSKFTDTIVAVDVNRKEGIAKLMKFSPDVILLDDAFQHRKVKAGFYILLTAYNDLYVDDLILPAGNLRESHTGASRAKLIVVTKCPQDLSKEEMRIIRKKLQPEVHQEVFFTFIKYSEKIISENEEIKVERITSDFVLVTGIANPDPLIGFLNSHDIRLKHFKFSDHHKFSEKEIEELSKENRILTTEKDYMRLRNRISSEKLYYLPIEVGFLNNKSREFDKKILDYINKNEV
ncbi:tetraacyldisaccharide 4'-kinase [Gramella lutea]|uniref:Tetraacyldisaccharide 4'-kinase n=1 Tax=Christiangramia lutea TaxID=1607951 RepID=A0A9X2AA69_9FLAO|nr:tetraacyldisaccharide 4'-kinase [Christiangramia lutea]MCH4824095.1 tetraacyldisaccharide 4'-kinase [Christiangramia lutea]